MKIVSHNYSIASDDSSIFQRLFFCSPTVLMSTRCQKLLSAVEKIMKMAINLLETFSMIETSAT